jgi:tRNA(Arg) A34 adenosine deaminase TadA
MRQAIAHAASARAHGSSPFGALLVEEGKVVATAENDEGLTHDATGHAETNLVRIASRKLSRADLARCTLYTSTEPCAMCAGAIHWAGVPRVVFGLSATRLAREIGDYDFTLPCRAIFAYSENPSVTVVGPVLEDEALLPHRGFWEAVLRPAPTKR